MTQKEFDAARDGDMIELACENHPAVRYACKKVALSLVPAGKWRYNHRRSLFAKTGEECDCSAGALFALIEEEK